MIIWDYRVKITIMKKFLILLLIIGFLSIGIMGVSMMKSHSDCLVSGFEYCTVDVSSMLDTHAGVFSNLSNAVFDISLFLAIGLSLLVLRFIVINPVIREFFLGNKRENLYFEKLASYKKPFYGWLAIHENSPSFSIARI